MKNGKLYIVATPIGNLEDISARADKVLRSVSMIAAEDTRRTKKLLSATGISKRTISYREQVREKASAQIINELEKGGDVALVTDAGTPGLSDPGYFLVREAARKDITVVPIPGPSALAAAISASGMSLDSFVFEGFLPTRSPARRRRLEELGGTGYPLAIFESPRRLLATLSDIEEAIGNRHVVVARELTKIHEEFIRGSVREVADKLKEGDIKGEVTLLVEGGEPRPVSLELDEAVSEMRSAGLSASKTASILADLTGEPRRKIYDIAKEKKSSKGGKRDG
ncbi:MAG: 16S rRNA (cytidine(1402)-2'-O)-methyltransferase [bacterium]